jgi:hypothetical protein
MFFLSCGALSRPFSLVFVKTLPKEERPSRKRKKEEYNKKRRERSGEIVKGRSSIYRKILGYYSTIHLPFYPYFTISSTHAQPAQPASIRPAPQTPNMCGYCDFCSGGGLKKSKPARCGAGWEKANTRPASTRAHPYSYYS